MEKISNATLHKVLG